MIAREIQCGDKIRHPTPVLATRAAYSLEERYSPERFEVYPCKWCGFYHVGHSVYGGWGDFVRIIYHTGSPPQELEERVRRS